VASPPLGGTKTHRCTRPSGSLTPQFAAEVAADLRSLEGIVAKRAQAAQQAFALAEHEAENWLRARLHAGSTVAEAAPVPVPAEPAAPAPAEPAPADPAAAQPVAVPDPAAATDQ